MTRDNLSGGCPDGYFCRAWHWNTEEGFCTTGNINGTCDLSLSCPVGYECSTAQAPDAGGGYCYEVISC
jgi:hypothetical protein